MEALVDVERIDRVLLITLRREEKRNAINRALADALDGALNELDDDPEAWVGVLTGGESVFSAGSDLSADGDYITERGGAYGIIRRRRRKPLIAAVEGAALGGGLEIALACDLIVAARTASFGVPEVSRGVVPTCGGLFRALRTLPVNLAREMVLTGLPISAQRAHDVGFVNLVTDPLDAVPGAMALGQQICGNSPLAVQASLRAMNDFTGDDDERGWELTRDALESVRPTEDFKEGIRAFFEKRPPRWAGH